MGSVTPYGTASGRRYRVRYRKPDRSETDKRGFRTKREAEEFLASVEVSKLRGDWIDSSFSPKSRSLTVQSDGWNRRCNSSPPPWPIMSRV